MTQDHASNRTFRFLEAQEEGLYSRMIEATLAQQGLIIQVPDYFICGYMPDPVTFHVIFAYGDLRGIMRFARFYATQWGFSHIEFSRQLAGRQQTQHTIPLTRFKI